MSITGSGSSQDSRETMPSPAAEIAAEELTNTFSANVPRMLLKYFESSGHAQPKFRSDHVHAAGIFADVSGFTALSEGLAEEGPIGAERLTAAMNRYFSEMITIIDAHGGDVLRFSGDALLAAWVTEEGHSGEDALDEVSMRVVACGIALKERLDGFSVLENISFRLRVGCGAGPAVALHLGGVRDRWEFVLAGEAVEEMCAAVNVAAPGEVVVSPSIRSRLGNRLTHSREHSGFVAVERLEGEPELSRHRPVALSPAIQSCIRSYVPRGMRSHIESGHTKWLAELRRVSVMFVNLEGLQWDSAQEIERLQTAMTQMQHAIFKYDGTIEQFLFTDKGWSMVAAFGVPPLSHEDDAVRAVLAAREIHAELGRLWIDNSIGITTGQVYCGVLGSESRWEYAIMGNSVNLAARFMGAREHRVVCDEATEKAARNRIQFESLPGLSVKGKTENVAIFRPRLEQTRTESTEGELVGRELEQEQVLAFISEADDDDGPRVLVIEGHAGMGKSALVRHAIQSSAGSTVRVILSSGDPIESDSPYFVWRGVFAELLQAGQRPDRSELYNSVRELLSYDEDLTRLLPLLGAVMTLDFHENETTEQMTGDSRAENTQRLLLEILNVCASSDPIVIVIEDVHWLDSVSLSLLRQVCSGTENVRILITTRPPDERTQPEYYKLIEDTALDKLQLEQMPPGETAELVERTLNASSIEKSILDLVNRHAEGNPFFVQELALALVESGVIEVHGRRCTVKGEAAVLDDLDFPHSIERIITSRVDRLSPRLQLLLKVASIIGRIFAYQTLHSVHPHQKDKAVLKDSLAILQRLDITTEYDLEPNLTYIFKHIITQEVVYQSIPFAQREELHAAVAGWYEKHATSSYSLLAHHWRLANNTPKALEYLAKAAQEALLSGANREATRLFKQCIELAGGHPGSASPSKVAQWLGQLGDAYLRMSRYEDSRMYLARGLEALQRPWPKSQNGAGLEVLRSMCVQLLHQLSPTLFVRPSKNPQEDRQVILIYELLAYGYYYDPKRNDLRSILLGFYAVNLSERLGPSGQLARSYAFVGVLGLLLGMPRIARRYLRLGRTSLNEDVAPADLGGFLQHEGYYYTGMGRLDKAIQTFENAVASYSAAHDRRKTREVTSLQIVALTYAGRFEDALSLADPLYETAQKEGEAQDKCWSSIERGNLLMFSDKLDLAERCLLAVLPIAEELGFTEKTWLFGVLARLYLRQGNDEEAKRFAERALEEMRSERPIAFYQMDGYLGACDVFLSLIERNDTADAHIELSAGRALKATRVLAKIFPIARPRYYIYEARFHALRGRQKKRARALDEAEKLARDYGMPYETALAAYERLRISGGAAGELFEQVRAQLEALNLPYELGLLKAIR